MSHSDTLPKTFDISTSYNQFIGSGTIYSYLGEVSQTGLDSILVSAEASLNKVELPTQATKKIFNILVEGLQNIFLYQKKNNQKDKLKNAFVLVNKAEDFCKIVVGNYICKNDTSGVKSRIEIVNNLDEAELKDLYRGVLDIGGKSEIGGAGLGFIDMAKRSSSQLISAFHPVNDDFVFFTLELEVKY